MILKEATVFSTPWFEVIERTIGISGSPEAYYSLRMSDYVCVVVVTSDEKVILVRQYRPATDSFTLELPAGHVDPGETPLESGRREVLEETGYVCGELELLGCLNPDTGRLSNRLWCYFARTDGSRSSGYVPEEGIEVLALDQKELSDAVRDQRLSHALNVAPLFLAMLKGNLTTAAWLSVK